MIMLLGVIGGIFTPIAVAIFGLRSEWNRKKSEKLTRLENEKKQEQDTTINNAIAELTTKINKMESKISKISDTIDKQDNTICSIAQSSKINGQYTYKLAQMFMVLAEGMRDQHLDGNITKAIESFRSFESQMLSTILTKYPDPSKDNQDNIPD